MRTIIKQLSLCALLLCSAASVRAQQTATSSRVLVAPGVEFFVPNWQIDIQTGGAYDLGEGKFVDLLSPALQLSTMESSQGGQSLHDTRSRSNLRL